MPQHVPFFIYPTETRTFGAIPYLALYLKYACLSVKLSQTSIKFSGGFSSPYIYPKIEQDL